MTIEVVYYRGIRPRCSLSLSYAYSSRSQAHVDPASNKASHRVNLDVFRISVNVIRCNEYNRSFDLRFLSMELTGRFAARPEWGRVKLLARESLRNKCRSGWRPSRPVHKINPDLSERHDKTKAYHTEHSSRAKLAAWSNRTATPIKLGEVKGECD